MYSENQISDKKDSIQTLVKLHDFKKIYQTKVNKVDQDAHIAVFISVVGNKDAFKPDNFSKIFQKVTTQYGRVTFILADTLHELNQAAINSENGKSQDLAQHRETALEFGNVWFKQNRATFLNSIDTNSIVDIDNLSVDEQIELINKHSQNYQIIRWQAVLNLPVCSNATQLEKAKKTETGKTQDPLCKDYETMHNLATILNTKTKPEKANGITIDDKQKEIAIFFERESQLYKLIDDMATAYVNRTPKNGKLRNNFRTGKPYVMEFCFKELRTIVALTFMFKNNSNDYFDYLAYPGVFSKALEYMENAVFHHCDRNITITPFLDIQFPKAKKAMVQQQPIPSNSSGVPALSLVSSTTPDSSEKKIIISNTPSMQNKKNEKSKASSDPMVSPNSAVSFFSKTNSSHSSSSSNQERKHSPNKGKTQSPPTTSSFFGDFSTVTFNEMLKQGLFNTQEGVLLFTKLAREAWRVEQEEQLQNSSDESLSHSHDSGTESEEESVSQSQCRS